MDLSSANNTSYQTVNQIVNQKAILDYPELLSRHQNLIVDMANSDFYREYLRYIEDLKSDESLQAYSNNYFRLWDALPDDQRLHDVDNKEIFYTICDIWEAVGSLLYEDRADDSSLDDAPF